MGKTVIKNREREIPKALKFVQNDLEKGDFSRDFAIFIDITIDEVLSNIIHYAYTDKDAHEITIETKSNKSTFTLTFEDDGIPFNPLSHVPETQADIPLVHRKKGGLGIYLITRIVDDIKYERVDGKNILTLIKTEDKTSKL